MQAEGLSTQTRGVARSFTRRTVQPEIVSESETTLTLRDVSLGSAFSLPQLLHRMYQVVLGMLEDSGRSWEAVRPPSPVAFVSRDDDVDRHAWLVERVLGLRFGSGAAVSPDRLWPSELYGYLLVARALERIADHAVSIEQEGTKLAEASLSRRSATALTTYHRQALDHLRRSYAVAERPDADVANDVIDAGEALHATHSALTESLLSHGNAARLSPLTVHAVVTVLHSIDRATAYAQDIAEVGLDRATLGGFTLGDRGAAAELPSHHISTRVEPGGKARNERKPD
jgi:hypothetical protein